MNCKCDSYKENEIFCIEEDCNQRLVCLGCFIRKRNHQGHKYILINDFVEGKEQEMKTIFGDLSYEDFK